jgi:CubicO group peptidase (beta-lactamase class C family)
MTPRVARVTLRQLRTMTGGFLDTWDGTDEDQLDAASNWTRFILGHRDRAPARSSATPTRNRIINGPPRTASEIGWVLVASAALVLVFASLTMRRYRAKQ